MLYGQHRCSYNNSTKSSVNKLFLFFHFSFFHFSFQCVLFFKFVKESFLLNLLDTKVNRERERERECVCVSPKSSRERGGQVVRWCWVNFQRRGVLLIWIIIGLGPIALAVGADGGCLDIFPSFLSFFRRRPDID